ncbi:MAG: hydrogenase nickel incorporation protein HypB [Sulfuricellaceae bacterium]
MCTVCGCGQGETKIEGRAHIHEHVHEHGGQAHSHPHEHGHGDEHEHSHSHDGDVHYGHGAAHAHAPGVSQGRMVQIEQDILAKNDAYAAENRKYFTEHGIFALNLVSSPGSGKTTLLTRTIEHLKGRSIPIAVIEGDQQTTRDADRIRATGVAALQINTGKGCHLDAHMIGHAAERLSLPDDSLLLIENVGNLVCPAAFDLGEAHMVAILSVTEGEDKPLKYPDMFVAADVMLLNKIDLLPYLSFNVPLCLEYAQRINPNIKVILISAASGEGMDEWQEWLEQGLAVAQQRKAAAVETLHRRIADLEAELAMLKGR